MPADTEDVVRALELARTRAPLARARARLERAGQGRRLPRGGDRMGKGLDRFEMKGATAIVGAGMPTPILARRTAEAGFVGVERFIEFPAPWAAAST